MEINDAINILNLGQNDEQRDEAESVIYNRMSRLIYVFLYRRIGTVQDAEDVASDVFLRFFQRTRQGDLKITGGEEGLKRYLFSTARFLTLQLRRSVDYQLESLRPQLEDWEDFLDELETGSYSNISTEPLEESLLAKYELVRVLGSLSPKNRELIMLKYFYGYSAIEIAKRFKISMPVYYTRLSRLLQRLRRGEIETTTDRHPSLE